jgi:hypothetical protein
MSSRWALRNPRRHGHSEHVAGLRTTGMLIKTMLPTSRRGSRFFIGLLSYKSSKLELPKTTVLQALPNHGLARNADEGLRMAAELSPNFVLVDVDNDLQGIEFAKELREVYSTPVILFGAYIGRQCSLRSICLIFLLPILLVRPASWEPALDPKSLALGMFS